MYETAAAVVIVMVNGAAHSMRKEQSPQKPAWDEVTSDDTTAWGSQIADVTFCSISVCAIR